MTLLTDLWPATTDDSGTKTDGTVINATLTDAFKAAIEDNIHSLTNTTVKTKTIIDEVVAARGNLASLDARLSVGIDDDGEFIQGIVQRLTTDLTAYQNTGAAESDFAQYSVAADTFDTNGKVIRGTIRGSFAANGNAKTIKVYFGATSITLHATTTSGGQWRAEFTLTRTGDSAQILEGRLQAGATNIALPTPVTPAEDDDATVILKVTGTATSTADILMASMILELLR